MLTKMGTVIFGNYGAIYEGIVIEGEGPPEGYDLEDLCDLAAAQGTLFIDEKMYQAKLKELMTDERIDG